MPELVEIELLKQEINETVKRKTVSKIMAIKAAKDRLGPEEVCNALTGSRVLGASRRGKMLLLHFDRGLTMIIHLMLRGQVLLTRGDVDLGMSPLVVRFNDGTSLEFRQMGLRWPHLVSDEDVNQAPEISKLGIDVMDKGFNLERFTSLVKARRGAIKTLMQDQGLIAGLGNTYVNEILFVARVHPERDARSLTDKEIEDIYNNIHPMLKRGMEFGGSSAEAYLHLDGTPGRFQEHFQVFRRDGHPCLICSTPIQRVEVGGRGSFFCPHCQK